VAAQVAAYLDYLNEGLTAAAPDGPWKKSLREALANPLYHDLQTLQTASGRRYYTMPGKANLHVGRLGDQITAESFDAVLTNDVKKPQRVNLRRDDLLRDLTPSASPQAAYVASVLASVDKLDFADWDLVGVRALAALLANRQIDPVVQTLLAKELLHLSQPTLDWAGETRWKAPLTQLEEQKLDELTWQNPDDPPPAAALAAIRHTMEQLPTPAELEDTIRRRRAGTCNVATAQLNTVGVALKNGNDWEVTGGTDATDAGFVVDANNALTPALRRVDGHWRADPAAGVLDGQLVFLAPSPK